jgi:hypothetical protein
MGEGIEAWNPLPAFELRPIGLRHPGLRGGLFLGESEFLSAPSDVLAKDLA